MARPVIEPQECGAPPRGAAPQADDTEYAAPDRLLVSRQLGEQIRELRKVLGLTLVELAAACALSHPFLSQVERGRALPSMASLHRIATALGTSQADLLSRSGTDLLSRSEAVTVVPAGLGTALGGPRGGYTALLVSGPAAFHPMIFDAPAHAFEDYFVHSEDEFAHVIEGQILLDLGGGDIRELGVGDSVYYIGGVRHRWSGLSPYRLFVVKDGGTPWAAP